MLSREAKEMAQTMIWAYGDDLDYIEPRVSEWLEDHGLDDDPDEVFRHIQWLVLE